MAMEISAGANPTELSVNAPEFSPGKAWNNDEEGQTEGGIESWLRVGYWSTDLGWWVPYYLGKLKSYNSRTGYGFFGERTDTCDLQHGRLYPQVSGALPMDYWTASGVCGPTEHSGTATSFRRVMAAGTEAIQAGTESRQEDGGGAASQVKPDAHWSAEELLPCAGLWLHRV